MKLRLTVVVLLLFSTAFAADDPATQIDRLLTSYYDLGLLNGAVLVADHGQVIYEKGFGYANMEWQVPNTPDTKFRIASVTKTFTAVLVLQQVAAGKIRLDAPIAEYIPEYRKDTAAKVTIRHLLTHTSGIPTYVGKDMNDVARPVANAEFLARYCSRDLESEPGAKWAYNNCGYFMLAMILERVTGKKYAELLREGVTAPAGMNDTGIDDGRVVLTKRAYGYDKDLVRKYVTADFVEMSTAFGTGDVYSTAEDLFRFDRALYADKLLPTDLRRQMFTPGPGGRSGFAWFVRKAGPDEPSAGDTLQSHEGHLWGFFTYVTRIPERQALVVVIDNTGLDEFDTITDQVLHILYRGTFTMPKRPVADVIAPTILRDGVAAGLAQYRELKRTGPEQYRFSSGELSGLGWQLIGAGRAKDAIEVFKENVAQFPDRWSVHYGLGEAYRGDGQKALALEQYDKTLKISPNNPMALQAMRQLNAAAPGAGK